MDLHRIRFRPSAPSKFQKNIEKKYGYPEITPEIRAKIFGLNAAKPYGISPREIRKRAQKDGLGRYRQSYLERPDPSFRTYGPKTRREFFELARNSDH